MRQFISAIIIAMLLVMTGAPAYADMGLPSSPKYTVVTNIYGTPYYSDYSDCESGYSAGEFAGGKTFYVWMEYDNGYLEGATDPSVDASHTELFVYIRKGDVMYESDTVSPDVGKRMDETIHASTTEKLNLRCGPGTGFKVLKVLKKGAEVNYDYTFDTDTTWAYVNANGAEGWVSRDFLQRIVETQREDIEEDSEEEKESPNNVEQEKGDSSEGESNADSVDAKRRKVIGIILICIGASILIATLAVYILRKRQRDNYPRW